MSLAIKNKGIEIDVSDTKNKHIGDLWVSGTEVIWCKGKISRQNGIHLRWEDFIKKIEEEN